MASTVTRNAQIALDYFKSRGWTAIQAAAIVGNLQAESTINLDHTIKNSVGAYGIAQWLYPARVQAFQNRYNVPLTQSTFEQQLDFVNYELTDGTEAATGKKLKATNTIEDASFVVFRYYENPGDDSLQKRTQLAQTLSGVPAGPLSTVTPEAKPQSESDNAETKKRTSDVFMINAPPIPNRLHEYPSYIYSLSLNMMTVDEYNKLVETMNYVPKNVIISSAGRHSQQFPRNPNWNEDFYFENFNLTTVISPNDMTRNTNAIVCDFDIIEPYGFTMVERILKTTEDLGGTNYLEMPYLVQIDFFAIDDAGEIKGEIPELQKRFPIRLVKMDIKLSERGAEYKLQGVPIGHTAFMSSVVTVPANIEVTAKTVADFFKSAADANGGALSETVRRANEVRERQPEMQKNNVSPLLYNSTGQSTTVNVDSLGSALNAYCKGLKDIDKVAIPDVYKFEFLPDPDTGEDVIGKAMFVEDKRNTPKETPMMKNTDIKHVVSGKKSDLGDSQNIYDTTRGIFSINHGTTIDKVLEYVIRNSTYIHQQLVLPDGISAEEYAAKKEKMKNEPLKWFRIIPKVKLLGFDTRRGKWAKEITYVVKPYKMYNLRSDIAPQGVVVTPVKAYNHIFTGKNSDIISLDMSFNTLYYTQQTANRTKMVTTSPMAEVAKVQNAPNYSGSAATFDYNVVMPLAMQPVTQNSKGVATGNPSDAKEVGAADLAESIMTSSMADMLGVKMTIVGDPDFIKQDDLFYGPEYTSNQLDSSIDSRLINGGSLVMDNSGLYVQILFKVPRDIDDETGFMKYNDGERNSVFSGLYQVLTVTSNFSKGQFTQELNMVRLPRQVAFDYVGNNTKNKSNVRPESTSVSLNIIKNPDSTAATATIGSTPEDDGAVTQSAGQSQRAPKINNAEQPAESLLQRGLRLIRDQGTTTTINEQNQSPAIPLPVGTILNLNNNEQ